MDAVVQAVRGVSQEGYGYYAGNLVRDGHFAGCLVDGGSPPPHLVDSIWQTLFNCGSAQARGARHRMETRIFLGWHERETLAAGALRASQPDAVAARARRCASVVPVPRDRVRVQHHRLPFV